METMRYHFNYEHLSLFLSRHSSLKTIHLDIGKEPFQDELGIFQTIGHSCKELEEFKIAKVPLYEKEFSALQSLNRLKLLEIDFLGSTITEECILQLQSLKSLKTLKIGDFEHYPKYFSFFNVMKDYGKYIPAVSQLTNLRELHLFHYVDRQTSNQLALCTQLTRLYIYRILSTGINLVDIIRPLTNLEELTLEDKDFVLHENEFSEIVKIVEGRPNVLTLKCRFSFVFNGRNCDENQKVRLID